MIKVHLLVSELYIHQNAWCNDKNCDTLLTTYNVLYLGSQQFQSQCHKNLKCYIIFIFPKLHLISCAHIIDTLLNI